MTDLRESVARLRGKRHTHCAECCKPLIWDTDEPLCASCAGERDARAAIAAALKTLEG